MHAIWIEIPATDLPRAKRFYEEVFDVPSDAGVLEGDGRAIIVIDGSPTVSLNQTPGFTPTLEGTLPYFHLELESSVLPSRVAAAGGTVIEAPAPRGDHGVFTLVADSEGNGIYVHTAT